MFRRGRRLNALVLWALVPLTVAGSLPRTGCICANGDYKLWFGGMPTDCCLKSELQTKTPGQRSCCRGATHSPPGSCCHSTGKAASCPTAVASRSCTPVVGVPVLPPLKGDVAPPSDDLPLALLITPIEEALPGATANVAVVRNADLPAPDLVIAHQVFLI